MIKFITEKIEGIRGLEFHFFIRMIGSKFRCVTSDKLELNDLLHQLLEPLELNEFLKSNGPSAFLDISMKHIPKCDDTGDKVIKKKTLLI